MKQTATCSMQDSTRMRMGCSFSVKQLQFTQCNRSKPGGNHKHPCRRGVRCCCSAVILAGACSPFCVEGMLQLLALLVQPGQLSRHVCLLALHA